MGVPANLGFLRHHPPREGAHDGAGEASEAMAGDKDDEGDGAMGVAARDAVARELVLATRIAEPSRWEGRDERGIHELLDPQVGHLHPSSSPSPNTMIRVPSPTYPSSLKPANSYLYPPSFCHPSWLLCPSLTFLAPL